MNPRIRPNAPRVFVALLAVLTAGGVVGGCAAAGFIAHTLGGNPDVKALYVPAKDPMLVLVENYRAPASAHESEHLGRCIEAELTSHKIAPLVDSTQLYALRSRDPQAFKSKSIASLGKETAAKQVLYVDVVQNLVDATPGSDMIKGQLLARVRIVDVKTGATRWPADSSEGYPVEIETPYMQVREGLSTTQIREEVYKAGAVDIVRLFHDWEPESGQ